MSAQLLINLRTILKQKKYELYKLTAMLQSLHGRDYSIVHTIYIYIYI